MFNEILKGASALLPFVGGILGGNREKKARDQEAARQLAFAQNSIQWKVKDAEAAGIHPLAALGAQTASYTPQPVGEDSIGRGLSEMGQSLGRAGEANRTAGERSDTQARLTALSLERAQLENDKLRAEIAVIQQPANPPPRPSHPDRYRIAGQGDTIRPVVGLRGSVDGIEDRVRNAPAVVDVTPLETRSTGKAGYGEPAAISQVGWTRTDTGGYMPVMSADAAERLQDDLIGSLLWSWRNRVLPNWNGSGQPDFPPPPGHRWTWDHKRQEFYAERIK